MKVKFPKSSENWKPIENFFSPVLLFKITSNNFGVCSTFYCLKFSTHQISLITGLKTTKSSKENNWISNKFKRKTQSSLVNFTKFSNRLCWGEQNSRFKRLFLQKNKSTFTWAWQICNLKFTKIFSNPEQQQKDKKELT